MNKKLKGAVGVLAFALIPFGICVIYAAMQGVMLWDINPLAVQLPQWCDEVYYYIQAKCMADGTMPLGYLGFNESTAQTGTLGAWSVFVLYPYALLGKIFGMTPFSMIVCNIIFMTAAFAVFYILARPSVEQAIKIVLIFAAVPLIARYTLSGMSEALFFAGCIVVAGFTIHFVKGAYSRRSIAVCYAVIVYLALCRPYLLAFALIPLYFHFRLKKAESFFLFGGATVLFGGLYVGYVSPRCAEYFFPIVDMSLFSILLRKGPMEFLIRVKRAFVDGMNAFRGFYETDTWQVVTPYQLLKLVTIVVLVCAVIIFVKCRFKKLDEAMAGVISVVIVVSIVLALIVLYVEYTSARHIIAVAVFMMMITAMYLPGIKNLFTVAVVAAMFYVGWTGVGQADITYRLSTSADEFGSAPVTEQAEKLSQLFVPSEEADPWDNTVVYIYSVENMNYCYCLPPYCGVNICEKEWVESNLSDIKSAYIMAEGGEDVTPFTDAGWSVAIAAEDYIIFER